MSGKKSVRFHVLLPVVLWLSGCAGTTTLVASPAVTLESVEVGAVSFSQQTFLLGFRVANPNPFPLPVKMVRYAVMLEDRKFASGETEADFTIPAGGDGSFVISVDLDLLQSGPQLASIVRSGARENIDYGLHGSLAFNIPFTSPISFSDTGTIMVQSNHW